MATLASPLFHSLSKGPQSIGQADLSLACDDGILRCHSSLFAAASTIWQTLLVEEEEEHTVLLPGIGTSLAKHVLQLLYTGVARPEARDARELRHLLAALLPHLTLAVSDTSLTVEASVVKEDRAELEGYQPVSQTDLVTNWEKEESEEEPVEEEQEEEPVKEPVHESWHDQDLVEDHRGQEDCESDTTFMNQNLILKSEVKKKADNKSCSICQKTFLYPKDLKKHELIHEQTFPFRCKLCKKGIRTISNTYKHLRVKHSLTENLKAQIVDSAGRPYLDPKTTVVDTDVIPPEFLDADHVMAQGSQGQNKSGVPLFACLICDKRVTKYALKNHLSIHNGDNKFKCDLCPKSYFTNSSLSNHKVASHQDSKGTPFKCSGCFRTFRTAKVRDHHSSTCLKDGKSKKEAFECRLCNKMFGYKNNLTAHQRSAHGLESKKVLEYSCKHCKEVIKGKLRLSKHIITAHPDVSGELCDLCGKSFQTEVKLLRHVLVHKSRERNLHCSFCPKKFFRKDILQVHEKVHTNPIICKKCGKKFPEERYLESHMLLHMEKTHNCMYCSKSFLNTELLAKHYKEHSDSSPHNCNFCPKGFQTKLELKKHKSEDHSDDFPLKCHICQKGFLHDSQLEKHIDLVHSKAAKQLIFCQHCDVEGGRVNQELGSLYSLKRHLTRHKCPLVSKPGEECSTCSRDPETYYKLRNHIKVNDNKKVLPCTECDKKFKTMQDLTTHSVVHTGQKPYSCQLCGDKFTQKCSLKTHYQRHKQGTVGVRAFQCSLCQKACKTYAALKSHQKSHQQGGVLMQGGGSSREVMGGAFPHLVFQAEPGLPLLSLDSSQQFQVTTINIDNQELEVETAGGLEGLIMEPGLVGLTRGSLGIVEEGGGEYKIQIIDDLPAMAAHSVTSRSLTMH